MPEKPSWMDDRFYDRALKQRQQLMQQYPELYPEVAQCQTIATTPLEQRSSVYRSSSQIS